METESPEKRQKPIVGRLRWFLRPSGDGATVESRTAIAGLVAVSGVVGAATATGDVATPLTSGAPTIAGAGVALVVLLAVVESAASGRPLGLIGGLLTGGLLLTGPVALGVGGPIDALVVLLGALCWYSLFRERDSYLADDRSGGSSRTDDRREPSR